MDKTQRCRQSQGHSSVLRVPAAAVAASPPESPPSAPRQPFHAARDTQPPLTDVLCALKQELAKCISRRQTVLRENSEESRLKTQETPLKIKPLRKTREKVHRTRLGLRREWDISRSYLPPASPWPRGSPTHLPTSLRALGIAWRLSEPDLNGVRPGFKPLLSYV